MLELVSKGLRVPLDKSFDLKDAGETPTRHAHTPQAVSLSDTLTNAESYEVTVAIVRGHLDLTQV